MDVMADKRPILFLFGKYHGNLVEQITAIEHEHSVFGLSDGGAHCGVLCDASVPTYMLAYMTRDRTKGPLMSLEFVVHKMTQDTALLYGLDDRGVIAPGYRADLNLIDYDALAPRGAAHGLRPAGRREAPHPAGPGLPDDHLQRRGHLRERRAHRGLSRPPHPRRRHRHGLTATRRSRANSTATNRSGPHREAGVPHPPEPGDAAQLTVAFVATTATAAPRSRS